VLALQAISGNLVASPNQTPPTGTDVYTSRTSESGLINTSNLSIFGPHICIHYGDPYSPLNSPWMPGLYTHHFRIMIPPDYADDIVRVELFDPDSINRTGSSAVITHTVYAQSMGFPVTTTRSTGSTSQKNAFSFNTGESTLIAPSITIDQINPFWFFRVDSNRGAGTPPGNGSCGSPWIYTPRYNTPLLFDLHYYAENGDNLLRVDLATYTSQIDDGVRDNGEHETDLRWVSPGGTVLSDQTAIVPVDAGSPADFELSLTQDLAGIEVDPATGNRYLYLDITSIDGASENNFEIWAGPLYPNSKSDVNARNLNILNNPDSHSSAGVTVTALNHLPHNSNTNTPEHIPLTYIEADQAGQSVYISLFDSDSGANPPIVFYLDTIPFTPDPSAIDNVNWAETEWALPFGLGGNDPDGVPAGSRCRPGSCATQWISPSYRIDIPQLTADCDPDNPDPQICTPFHGGRLMAYYDGGHGDTFSWLINTPSAAESITIDGATDGLFNTAYLFTATVSPPETDLPITYTWEATGQTAVYTTTSILTDTISFSWAVGGTKTITVTATNAAGSVIDTHPIIIDSTRWIYLPVIAR